MFNIINNTLSHWNTQSLSVGNYLVWLTIFIDGDTAISCRREVFLSNSTGVNEENISENISIYPNPSNGMITIDGNNILSIRIYNTEGKEIYRGNSSTFNFSKYQRGNYLVRIRTESGVLVKKLILNYLNILKI